MTGNMQMYPTSALGALAAAWPTLLCRGIDALSTPLQRALRDSFCGQNPSFEILGHCASCWSGAAALSLAALLVLVAPDSASVPASNKVAC